MNSEKIRKMSFDIIRSWRRVISSEYVRILGFVVAYFIASEIAFQFPASNGLVVAVWPAGGIALSALLLIRRSLWPTLLALLFIAGYAADLLAGRPLFASAGFMIANLLESFGSAWFIQRCCKQTKLFASARSVFALGGAAIFVNAGTAALGAATSSLFSSDSFSLAWARWWIADGLGIILVTPLIITWSDLHIDLHIARKRVLETTLFITIWAIAVYMTFHSAWWLRGEIVPRPYVLIALLIWLAIRLNQRELSIGLLLLACISIESISPTHMSFPFPGDRILTTQLFVAFAAFTAMLLAGFNNESKLATSALRDTLDLKRHMLESVREGIIVYDNELRYLVWNKFMENLTGVKSSELLGRQILEAFPFLAQTNLVPQLRRALNGDESTELELHFVLPNGRQGWTSHISSPLRNKDGKIIGIISTVRDLTSKKQSMEALANSRAKLKAAFTSMTETVFTTDPEGRLLEHNKAFVKFLRLEHGQAYPKSVAEYQALVETYNSEGNFVIPESDLPVPAALRGETIAGAEYTLKRRDTGESWIGSFSFSPIRDTNGNIIGSVVIARDVTDARRAEAELLKSKLHLQMALKAADLGAFTRNLVSDSAVWNDRSREIWGFSPDAKLRYEALIERVYPEDRTIFDNWTRRGVLNKDNVVEYRIQRPDGIRWLQTRGSAVTDAQGEVIDVRGIVADVTEQRRTREQMRELERQLEVAQRMEAIGRLAGGVAHDFNNLLMVIRISAELTQEIAFTEIELQDKMRVITDACDKAATLTSQLLAFGRKQITSPVVLDVNAVVREISTMLVRLMGENIEMRFEPAPDLWAVRADAGQLSQVLMNLCVNARDAMPNGGVLTISTKNVSSSSDLRKAEVAEGDYVLISVHDTGTGISESAMPHIFEPFFTTKSPDKGSGLGLSTVYGIARQNGGTVWASSHPNEGTCFTVCLPRAYDAINPQASSAKNSRGPGNWD